MVTWRQWKKIRDLYSRDVPNVTSPPESQACRMNPLWPVITTPKSAFKVDILCQKKAENKMTMQNNKNSPASCIQWKRSLNLTAIHNQNTSSFCHKDSFVWHLSSLFSSHNIHQFSKKLLLFLNLESIIINCNYNLVTPESTFHREVSKNALIAAEVSNHLRTGCPTWRLIYINIAWCLL